MCGGEVEYGICENCGKEDVLERRTKYYGIKCNCHSPEHFDMIRVCKKCNELKDEELKFPAYTKIYANPINGKDKQFIINTKLLDAMKDTYNLCVVLDTYESKLMDMLGIGDDAIAK